MIFGIVSVLAAAALVAADQGIKLWASANLQPVGAMPLLPGIVELRFCLNDGMAFSMLAGKQALLIGVTSLMLLAVLIMLFVRKMPLAERIAWTLVLGGGVGNLVDRVLNGVVVDYINVLFMNFAIFNFADICVCVGVALLIVAALWETRQDEKTAKAGRQTGTDAHEADGTSGGRPTHGTSGCLAGGAVRRAFPHGGAESDRAGGCDR